MSASEGIGARPPGAELADEDVVDRIRGGEVALYEVLMRRHNQRLYRAVRAILRDETEVEDILQETYLAAFRSLGGFAGRARFSTWLTRIAVNRALDRRRRRARVVDLDPHREESSMSHDGTTPWGRTAEDPERQLARRELARLLEEAVDALPDPFRGIYVLREVEGLTTREAAECLGIEAATAKTRLHRARSLLRERLIEDFDGATTEAFPFGAQRCDHLVSVVLELLQRRS